MGREQSLSLSIVVSSGSGTGTLANAWDIVKWLRIHPVNQTDTFNLEIDDANGRPMIFRTGISGTYSEKLEMSLGIMKTIKITSASVDGTYICNLDMH